MPVVYSYVPMTAVFPGSFDPPTYGHLDIIERSSGIFDSLHILVAINPRKKSLLTNSQKINILRTEITRMKIESAQCMLYEGLIVDYCKSRGIHVVVRGVRNTADFEHEFEMAGLNSKIGVNIETVLIPANPNLITLRSSNVKEILYFGGDISHIVPCSALTALKKSFSSKIE